MPTFAAYSGTKMESEKKFFFGKDTLWYRESFPENRIEKY